MERLVGGTLAIVLFCAVVWIGIVRGLETEAVLGKALLVAIVGGLAGAFCFGPLGRAVIQRASRVTEEEAPAETEPPETEAAEQKTRT